MADAINSQLAAAAEEEAVRDWPPLDHADVLAWSQCAIRVIQMDVVEIEKVCTSTSLVS